jgi:hypothetical protein
VFNRFFATIDKKVVGVFVRFFVRRFTSGHLLDDYPRSKKDGFQVTGLLPAGVVSSMSQVLAVDSCKNGTAP